MFQYLEKLFFESITWEKIDSPKNYILTMMNVWKSEKIIRINLKGFL